jgi:predicted nucleic acid-binding protein
MRSMTSEREPAHLLDANALIALVVDEHEHHARAAAWVSEVGQVALCPIVESALVRYLLRCGEPQATAVAILSALYRSPRCAFWEDHISYAEARLGHISGHRQVTDAYLGSLAARRGARLGTFDAALVSALPDVAELIP